MKKDNWPKGVVPPPPRRPKKDPFKEKLATMVAERFGEDWADMEDKLVKDAETARRAKRIRDVAHRATSYKECLIAALEYHGWELDCVERVYMRQRGEQTNRIDPFFLEEFSKDPDSLYDRFFGDGVCALADEMWGAVSPSVKALESFMFMGLKSEGK